MSIIKEAFNSIPEESRIFIKRLDQISMRVKSILDHKEWTQKDLAEMMEKEPSEISKWLNSPHNLTLKTIAKLEAALDEPLITVPTTFHFNHDDDEVTVMTLLKTAEVPKSDQDVEDTDFQEPKGSGQHKMNTYVAANG